MFSKGSAKKNLAFYIPATSATERPYIMTKLEFNLKKCLRGIDEVDIFELKIIGLIKLAIVTLIADPEK